MPFASSHPAAGAGAEADSSLAGLLSNLDAVYGFACTLTGDSGHAADLTERVYRLWPQTLFATLGGHSLRDRLLARCLVIFTAEFRSRSGTTHPNAEIRQVALAMVLRDLPLEERAAVALVDQLGLSYAASAAVLGTTVDDLRRFLHRGRDVLLGRAAARDFGPAR